MAWIVTLQIVDCAAMGMNLPGTRISSPILVAPGFVITDANGQAQIFDATDTWEWVNVTISKAGGDTDPCHADYDPGYLDKNFVVHMDMDGTVQQVCLNKAPVITCNDADGDGNHDLPQGPCFIVTAATGTSASFEVTQLRAMREDLRRRSALCGRLIESVYSEYESFSPAIAAEIAPDAVARGLVLAWLVRPLFTWYRLAGSLAFEPADHAAHLRGLDELAVACGPEAPRAMILTVLEALRDGEALPEFAPPMLARLGAQIADLPHVRWAILDPLLRIWRLDEDRAAVFGAVADWLAAAPIEDALRPDTARADLATIAGFLAFAPDRRRALGERMATVAPDFAQILVEAGLVSPPAIVGEL